MECGKLGSKWDVDGDGINVVQLDDDRIIIEFDTAWGPPIEFYKHLESLGFDVVGMYYELLYPCKRMSQHDIIDLE